MALDPTTWITSLTEVRSSAVDVLGSIRREDGKVYKYIKYSVGSGPVIGTAGDLVVYHGDNGVDDNEVAKDYTDGGFPAGVLMANMADAQYGWIQVAGPCTLTTAIETSNDATPVACADYDPICIGDADGATRRANTVIDADAEREFEIGVAIDASAKKVVLTLPY